jgi:hypothetical protein
MQRARSLLKKILTYIASSHPTSKGQHKKSEEETEDYAVRNQNPIVGYILLWYQFQLTYLKNCKR